MPTSKIPVMKNSSGSEYSNKCMKHLFCVFAFFVCVSKNVSTIFSLLENGRITKFERSEI